MVPLLSLSSPLPCSESVCSAVSTGDRLGVGTGEMARPVCLVRATLLWVWGAKVNFVRLFLLPLALTSSLNADWIHGGDLLSGGNGDSGRTLSVLFLTTNTPCEVTRARRRG